MAPLRTLWRWTWADEGRVVVDWRAWVAVSRGATIWGVVLLLAWIEDSNPELWINHRPAYLEAVRVAIDCFVAERWGVVVMWGLLISPPLLPLGGPDMPCSTA